MVKMIASFLITFRETIEAALIVSILLVLLKEKRKLRLNVYYGVLSAIVASILTAIAFNFFAGGFEGASEKIFETITMLAAAALLTYVIIWMNKGLKKNLSHKMENANGIGIFLIAFFAVYREGVETVIFLNASEMMSGQSYFFGAISGIFVALTIAYIITVFGKKVDINIFFKFTSMVLVFFAAGLIAHSVHELHELGLIFGSNEAWNINSMLDEKSEVGLFMKALFGYNSNPSYLEVFSYLSYLSLICFFFLRKRQDS